MKKLNKKGFTLAELLIVVAIIAVMAAIAIPIFTAQLGKARAATDEANIRSGYANASANLLTSNPKDGTVWYLNNDGTVTEATATPTTAYVTKGNAADLGTAVNIGGNTTVTWTSGKSVTYTAKVPTTGNSSIEIAAK